MPKYVEALQRRDKQLLPMKKKSRHSFLNDFSYFLWIYFILHLQTFASQDGLTLVVIATFQALHAPHG